MSLEKITVYKIKPNATNFSDFMKTHDSKKNQLPTLKHVQLPRIEGFEGELEARVVFKEVGGKEKTHLDFPWLVFINQAMSIDDKCTFSWTNKFPSALIALKISTLRNTDFYVLTFGMAGNSYFDHDMIVHDFGIKVAMNICDEDKLNRIQTSIHEAVSTQTERQISANSNLSTFNINGEKEFLRTLVGHAIDHYDYIKSFQGKESIAIKIRKQDDLSWDKLVPRIHELGLASKSNRYKSIFKEYDKFPFETDPLYIAQLDEILFNHLKNGNYDNLHLSPPEFFDYENLMFLYQPDPDAQKYEELILEDLISQRPQPFKSNSNINLIKAMKISVYNATTGVVEKNKWSAYKCLVAEVTKDNKTYILSMGQWRCVSNELLQQVSDYIHSIPASDLNYLPNNLRIWNPEAKGGKNGKAFIGENQEGVFNEEAANNNDYLYCFDKGKIEIAGEKIYEVCDLFYFENEAKFIQVKRYSSGAASISHLFVQARFYAEAFLFDDNCRKAMKQYVNNNPLGKDVASIEALIPEERDSIIANNYTICLCLLTDKNNFQIENLPFMSKYELMHTFKYLQNLGFKKEIVIKQVILGQ